MKRILSLLLAFLIGVQPSFVSAYEIWSASGVSDTAVIVNASGVPASASSPSPSAIWQSNSVIDSQNTTTTPLAASAVYTGGWTSTLPYTQVAISVLTDQAATLQVQFSNSGSSVSHTHSYVVVGGIGKTVQVQPHGQAYRINLVNSGVPETSLNLISTLHPIPSLGTILEAGDVPTNSDDAALVKSIIAGSAVDGSGYKNVLTSPDGGLVINQNTQVDALNSTTVNLAAGATFTGPWVSDINYTAVQYIENSDKNMVVYIDQSSDGVNQDISDSFECFSAVGGCGNTVQLVGSYYRFRVFNEDATTSTHLRFQAIKVPFLESLPRTLSPEGNLKVAVQAIQDDNGFSPYFSPFGEQIAVPMYKLVGSVFNGSTLDTNVWSASSGVGGVAAPASGVMVLSTGTTANNSSTLQTNLYARFVAGEPNKYRITIVLPDTGTANNARRWGPFISGADGAYFQVSGVGATTSLSVCTMKSSVVSCAANGSFNGFEGSTFVLDTLPHIYEIITVPHAVYWFIDGELIHSTNPNTSWTSTLDLPVRFENTNSNGSTTNVSMSILVGTGGRLGIPETQPKSFFQSGTTAGIQVKLGAGDMRKAVISATSNNSVISFYDGTSTGGKLLWSSGAFGAQSTAFSLDFDKLPFNTGLFMTITGAASNLFLTYE
jgi:hypothetical protein